jgi:hypothetical protein
VLFCNVVQPSLRPFWTVAAFQVSWQWTSVRGACKILGNNPMNYVVSRARAFILRSKAAICRRRAVACAL